MTRATSALSLAALAAATLVSTACNDPIPSVPERTIAFVVFAAQVNEASTSGYALRPTALFFKTNSINFLQSGNSPDRCENRPYTAPDPAVKDTLPTVQYLDAGAALPIESTGGVSSSLLAQVDAFGKKYYVPENNAPITPFTPGDVVTLTVPGASGANAFPQTTVSQRTVEAFSYPPVATDANAPGGGLKITWSAPTTPPTGTAPTGMLMSLRYAASGDGPPDTELFCSVIDDGEFTIAGPDARDWLASSDLSHEIGFTRWRGEVIPGAIYKQIISSLEIRTDPTTTAATRVQ